MIGGRLRGGRPVVRTEGVWRSATQAIRDFDLETWNRLV